MDQIEPSEQSPDEVFLTAVLFEIALGAVALFLGWAVGPSARELVPKFELAEWWPIASGILYGCLAGIPILLSVELIRRIPWEPIQELERLTDDGMVKALLELRPAELIVISLCAGIGEELLFRGWLMCWLIESFQSQPGLSQPAALTAALVLSSIVFGLFHPITRMYIVLAAAMGVYFGALLIYTQNLLVPILAHATYDAAQLILTARSEHRSEQAA